jgi:hypothetical protein
MFQQIKIVLAFCFIHFLWWHHQILRSVDATNWAVTLRSASVLISLGHFHFGSLVQCPDEIWHNSAGIPAVPFKEPLPAYSRAHNCKALWVFWCWTSNRGQSWRKAICSPCSQRYWEEFALKFVAGRWLHNLFPIQVSKGVNSGVNSPIWCCQVSLGI